MPEPVISNRPLNRFAALTALAALVLIGLGGLVTSKGAGMAVPDWPNSFGYNMFFLPFSKWVGGIFYEHTHRLVASGVGLLTIVLALWLHGVKARHLMRWGGLALVAFGLAAACVEPRRWMDGLVLGASGAMAFGASFVWPRCQPGPQWLRLLGLVALAAVILQGVLGGLRVVLLKDQIGIVHAALAQLFFALLCAICLFTSPWWQNAANVSSSPATAAGRAQPSLLPYLCTALVFLQLLLGAAMRHQHAGLAIPDFPLAYGRLWPAMDADSVARYNAQRMEAASVNPITATQIALQMAHRAVAALTLAAVALCAWSLRRRLGSRDPRTRWALLWLGLVLFQALLGAATIWSNKAADIATAHVVAGALCLALGAMLSILSTAPLVQACTDPAPGAGQGPKPEIRNPKSEQQPALSPRTPPWTSIGLRQDGLLSPAFSSRAGKGEEAARWVRGLNAREWPGEISPA